MRVSVLGLLMIFVLFSEPIMAQKIDNILTNYLELSPEQLKEIGFEDKDQCLTFNTIIQDWNYNFYLCENDIGVSLNDPDNITPSAEKSYYPVLVLDTEGKVFFSSFRKDKKLDKPLLPILVSNTKSDKKKKHIFLFKYNDELSQKLSDINNIENYIVKNVKNIEDYLKKLERKNVKTKKHHKKHQ